MNEQEENNSYYPKCRCGVALNDDNYENGECDFCAGITRSSYEQIIVHSEEDVM